MRQNHSGTVGFWRLLLLAAVLIALRSVVVEKMPTPFRKALLRRDGTLPGVQQPLGHSYADGLHLIGYDRSASDIPADGLLRVDLYWTVRQQPSRRYQTVVHLIGPEGLRWSPGDSFRPTDYQAAPPTDTWEPGSYAIDSHEIEPLPGTPPGRYDVVLTVFDRETLVPLSALNDHGQPSAPELTLGQIGLSRPRRDTDTDALGIRQELNAKLGPLTLLGADIDRAEAVPGDPVYVTSFWRADERSDEDLRLCLALVGSQGLPLTEYTRSPAARWYPTSAWRRGDVWRGQHLLHLPADLDAGVYTWTLSLSPNLSPGVPVSPLSVTAPSRRFASPPVDVSVDVGLGEVATLLGANVEPPTLAVEAGSSVTVTLVWRAEAETRTSYHAFLHLVDQQGRLIAQSDGVPDRWSRPTTGWMPGEIIIDERPLYLPREASPGDYTLLGGLYEPGGERLADSHGRDALRLGTVTVRSRE